MPRPAHPWVLILAALIAKAGWDDAPARADFWSVPPLHPVEEVSFAFEGAGRINGFAADGLTALDRVSAREFVAPPPLVDYTPPVSLLRRFRFGSQASGSRTSSPPPRTGLAPTGSIVLAVELFARPEVPRAERGGRLAIENSSWNHPSFPSRLFRPPRGHA